MGCKLRGDVYCKRFGRPELSLGQNQGCPRSVCMLLITTWGLPTKVVFPLKNPWLISRGKELSYLQSSDLGKKTTRISSSSLQNILKSYRRLQKRKYFSTPAFKQHYSISKFIKYLLTSAGRKDNLQTISTFNSIKVRTILIGELAIRRIKIPVF